MKHYLSAIAAAVYLLLLALPVAMSKRPVETELTAEKCVDLPRWATMSDVATEIGGEKPMKIKILKEQPHIITERGTTTKCAEGYGGWYSFYLFVGQVHA